MEGGVYREIRKSLQKNKRILRAALQVYKYK